MLFLFPHLPSFAQQKHTISGYVTDHESGESLIGASVYLPHLKKGTITNNYGFYSLTLPQDTATLQFSFVGYNAEFKTLKLQGNLRLDVELQQNTVLEEVTIKADKEDFIKQPQMGLHKLSIKTIETAPVLMGETDILKTLQLLPGVASGNEGSAGLYVRGGSPDQNLILLDGVPVYNVFHLFGFLSVFNPDAIHDVTLIKGGIPARYGGRLSSVLDISMKEGNLKEKHGTFSLSPVAGRFTFETPIRKNVSSFIISGRRTWLDAIGSLLISDDDQIINYNFYDLNLKYNHKFNDRNRIYASVYTGRDKFFNKYTDDDVKSTYNFRWGNITSVVRWNCIFGPKLFANFSANYSNYTYFQENEIKDNTDTDYWRVRSRIQDWTLQSDFDLTLGIGHNIKYGVQLSAKRFSPEVFQFKAVNIDTSYNNQSAVNALNAEAYIEDEFDLGQKFRFNIGVRGSVFAVNNKTYANLQPRLSGRYLISNTLSIKASYTQMAQYLHLLTNSSLGVPTDLWVSSTDQVAPQYAEQVAVGLSKTFFNNNLEVSLEGYYKKMDQLIEYRDGANYLYNRDESWEEKVVSGKGASRGIELFINKKQGKFTGWLGYTLAYSDRWFDEIDQGRKFPFKYDRRHDISLLMNYKFNERKSLSATFVYGTGNAITLASASYQGMYPPNYELSTRAQAGYDDYLDRQLIDRRNNFRMPAYHRMDLSYQSSKETKKGNKRTWIFSVYNVYNHLNPYFLYESNGQLKQMSLFPIIPSVTYRLEF